MAREGEEARIVGESRWPMAAAVVAAIVLTILLPRDQRLLPAWVLPLIEGILLVALIAGDPGAIDRRSKVLRALSIALVSILVLSALTATTKLIDVLITGGPQTNSASDLLAGRLDHLGRQHPRLRTALLGARQRWRGSSCPPHARPRRLRLPPADESRSWLRRAGAREFVDYLYLAFTNATALSPTDAMPIAHWAKLAMMVQSVSSLAILGLVIARAVNVFA